LAAFAIVQWAARAARPLPATTQGTAWLPRFAGVAVAVAVCALVIDPARLRAAADPTYGQYPDHEGAAQFVESLHPAPHDIVVAEDALMQTYYLGHVDYWLQDEAMAAPYLHQVDGRWADIYTDTPLIGSGRQLERLVARRDRGAIYVIGSGEIQPHADLMEGEGIERMLDSSAFHLIYVGRDHLTDVWKVDAPQHSLTAASNAGRSG
jgi:hypothetical protein